MLLQADAKQLEFVCAAFLSQDPIAVYEITNEVDQHTDNQIKFGLPSRLVAKTFVFRILYGGSSYAFANDPSFKDIGNEEFWQNAIDQFYVKYQGLAEWHKKIVEEVKRNRKLVMPTGREYHYSPEIKYGKEVWPRTTILNYPVQGLGADLMAIARVSLANRLKDKKDILLVNTVHDSIILDYDDTKHDTQELVQLVDKCFNDVPMNFEKLFGVKFNLPMRVECEVGKDWGNMEKVVISN